ncbi:hypothetical protein D3C78_1207180 [compost metagenome]
MTAAHRFNAADLRHQHARFCHQETPRFNFQFDRMPKMRSDFVARRTPQAVVVIGIDRLFAFAIRDRQTAARRDRLQILTKIDHLIHHRTAHLLQVRIIHARTDMHVNAHERQIVALQYL